MLLSTCDVFQLYLLHTLSIDICFCLVCIVFNHLHMRHTSFDVMPLTCSNYWYSNVFIKGIICTPSHHERNYTNFTLKTIKLTAWPFNVVNVKQEILIFNLQCCITRTVFIGVSKSVFHQENQINHCLQQHEGNNSVHPSCISRGIVLCNI